MIIGKLLIKKELLKIMNQIQKMKYGLIICLSISKII